MAQLASGWNFLTAHVERRGAGGSPGHPARVRPQVSERASERFLGTAPCQMYTVHVGGSLQGGRRSLAVDTTGVGLAIPDGYRRCVSVSHPHAHSPPFL